MTYFDIIPYLELGFKRYFTLHNDRTGNKFIVCHYDDSLTSYNGFIDCDKADDSKFVAFCKTKTLTEDDNTQASLGIAKDFPKGSTWFEIVQFNSKQYENQITPCLEFNSLKGNVMLTIDEVKSIINIDESLINPIVAAIDKITGETSPNKLSGWYFDTRYH